MAKFVIDADLDAFTCPSCRVCVPAGKVCSCPMRTKGPAVEPLLPRLADGRVIKE